MKKFNATKLLSTGTKMRNTSPLSSGMYKLQELKSDLVEIESRCASYVGLRKSAEEIGFIAEVVFRNLTYKLLPATEALIGDGLPKAKIDLLLKCVTYQVDRIASIYDGEMQSVDNLHDLTQRMLFVTNYVLNEYRS